MDINLTSAGYFVHTPIGEKWKLNLGGRRSFYEFYLNLANAVAPDALPDFPPPFFWDYYNSISFNPVDGKRLDFRALGKKDTAKIDSPLELEDENGDLQEVPLNQEVVNFWTVQNIKWTSELDIADYSVFFNRLHEENEVILFGGEFSSLIEEKYKSEIKFRFDKGRNFKGILGFGHVFENIDGNVRIFSAEETIANQLASQNAKSDYQDFTNQIAFFNGGQVLELEKLSRHYSIFLADAAWVGDHLTSEAGAYSFFNYANQQFILDPRFSFLYNFNKGQNGFLRFGKYSQLPDFILIRPLQVPQPNDPDLDTPYTLQAALGTEWLGQYFISKSELYYKHGYDQVLLNPDFNNSEDPDQLSNPFTINGGESRSYGLEFSTRQKPINNNFGWLTYTLSRSERLEFSQDTGAKEWTLFSEDITHNINALYVYNLNSKWKLGMRFNAVSGRPYTPTLLVHNDLNANDTVESGELSYSNDVVNTRSGRLPWTFRFDIRLDYNFKIGNNKANLYFDFWNSEFFVYDNVSGYSTSRDYLTEGAVDDYSKSDFNDGPQALPENKLVGNSGLPFIPIIGISYEF